MKPVTFLFLLLKLSFYADLIDTTPVEENDKTNNNKWLNHNASPQKQKNALNKNPEHFERLMTRYTEVGVLTVRFSNAGCFLLCG